jgi:hypothetical protein
VSVGKTSENYKFARFVSTNQEGPLAHSNITEFYIRRHGVQHNIEGVALQLHQCVVLQYYAFSMSPTASLMEATNILFRKVGGEFKAFQ